MKIAPTENPERKREVLSQFYEIKLLGNETKEDIRERFEKGETIFWIARDESTKIILWSSQSNYFHNIVAQYELHGDKEWSGGRLTKKRHWEAEKNSFTPEQFDAVEISIRNFLNE